ncbi:MAG: YgfZ/GcvT domain-containing protein [Actinomycetota bacterium]
MDTALDEQVRALEERRGHLRADARVVTVRGADAERWLNDLVTAGVAGMPEGSSVRSLVLTPTGRIRAEFHVLRAEDGFALVQGSDQPEPVDAILAPYVLSSAVELSASLARPVLVPSDDGWRAALEPPAGSVEVDAAAAERWRIEHTVAVFPVDLGPDSLPAEAGLDVPPVTDTAKGCFLGQESVARVRNLGHPTWVVLPARADGRVRARDVLVAGEAEVGIVTSAAERLDGSTAVLARLRWDARDAELRTPAGALLERR